MAGTDLAALQKRLAAIPPAVRKAVEPALQGAADDLVARMKSLAPHDTGKLENSITSTPAGQPTPPYSQPGGSEVVPENTVRITAGDEGTRYVHLVEHGTAKAPAQPFFFPAFRLSRARIQRRISGAITRAVKKEWSA